MDRIDYTPLMELVARCLCGNPNKHLSKPGKELRFGTHGSLSVDLENGVFYNHEDGVGGGVLDLIRHKTGLANGEAVEWLKSEFPNEFPPAATAGNTPTIVAEYDYTDENGTLLYQVVRKEPKDFFQRRPNGNGGWVPSTKGVRQVLYRLTDVLALPEGATMVNRPGRHTRGLFRLVDPLQDDLPLVDLPGRHLHIQDIRAGLIEFRRRMEALQWQVLIPQLCRPVWQRFVQTAQATGDLPSGPIGSEWTAPRFEAVDPMKDAKADLMAVRAGFMSLKEAIARNGYDPTDVLSEIAETNAALDRLGLVLDSDPRRSTQTGAAKEEVEDEEDEAPPVS